MSQQKKTKEHSQTLPILMFIRWTIVVTSNSLHQLSGAQQIPWNEQFTPVSLAAPVFQVLDRCSFQGGSPNVCHEKNIKDQGSERMSIKPLPSNNSNQLPRCTPRTTEPANHDDCGFVDLWWRIYVCIHISHESAAFYFCGGKQRTHLCAMDSFNAISYQIASIHLRTNQKRTMRHSSYICNIMKHHERNNARKCSASLACKILASYSHSFKGK